MFRPRNSPAAFATQQGAVIPGATVTISDETKGFSRATTSEADGTYRLLLLPPGTYTLTAKAKGFATSKETGIVLNVRY